MRVFRLARLNSDNYMCLPLPAAEKKVMIMTKELCLSRSLFLSLSRVLLLFVSEKKSENHASRPGCSPSGRTIEVM